MLIDCETCVVRDVSCADCVVTVLLASAPVETHVEPRLELDRAEQAAIAVLAGSGLVPPLRLVPPVSSAEASDSAGSGPTDLRGTTDLRGPTGGGPRGTRSRRQVAG